MWICLYRSNDIMNISINIHMYLFIKNYVCVDLMMFDPEAARSLQWMLRNKGICEYVNVYVNIYSFIVCVDREIYLYMHTNYMCISVFVYIYVHT
jgi:hypothetical protein